MPLTCRGEKKNKHVNSDLINVCVQMWRCSYHTRTRMSASAPPSPPFSLMCFPC